MRDQLTLDYGLCKCGCGQRTSIAPQTHRGKGWIKGEPLRFIQGHGSRGRKKTRPATLICKACGVAKPQSAFPERGFECRACIVVRVKNWQRRNPDRVRAYQQSEKRRVADKRWRDRNREKKQAKDRAYARENRAKLNAKHKAWRKRNLEHFRIYARERMRLRNLGRDHVAYTYDQLLRFDPCSYCGRPARTVDHVVPISRGGTNEWENLTAACGDCNRSKKNAPLLKFLLRHEAPNV